VATLEELKTYPLALHLSLEISDASGWRRAVANGDFPGDKPSAEEALHPGCARLRIKSSRVLSAFAVCRLREPTRDGPLVWQEMEALQRGEQHELSQGRWVGDV
jgi:hypothetical protein